MPSLDDLITWQTESDERERVRIGQRKIQENQKTLNASMTAADQHIFGMHVEEEHIHFVYLGTRYSLTYSEEQESWQLTRLSVEQPCIGALFSNIIPKRSLIVNLLRILAVDKQTYINGHS